MYLAPDTVLALLALLVKLAPALPLMYRFIKHRRRRRPLDEEVASTEIFVFAVIDDFTPVAAVGIPFTNLPSSFAVCRHFLLPTLYMQPHLESILVPQMDRPIMLEAFRLTQTM
jgi:hypothetical protein